MTNKSLDLTIKHFTTSTGKRLKIKRGIREILKENGFKRNFFRHPLRETYSSEDTKVIIFSEVRGIGGAILPSPYRVTGVITKGDDQDPTFENINEKLGEYINSRH